MSFAPTFHHVHFNFFLVCIQYSGEYIYINEDVCVPIYFCAE